MISNKLIIVANVPCPSLNSSAFYWRDRKRTIEHELLLCDCRRVSRGFDGSRVASCHWLGRTRESPSGSMIGRPVCETR